MSLQVEAYEGELDKLRKVFEMIKHLSAEKLEGVYFICGDAGEKDDMGLPKMLLICPGYGLDGFAVYTKTSPYSAPEF